MPRSIDNLAFQFWIGLGQRFISIVDRLKLPADFARHTTHPRTRVTSGNRSLQACLVVPPQAPDAALLILPGIGDLIEYWAAAQTLLAQQAIASLIIQYSGHAGSTGSLTPPNLLEDAQAAYAHLRSQLPQHTPVFVLGFSLGSGLAAQALPHLHPTPAGLILAQPFTSLRLAAAEVTRPLRILSYLVPDIWRSIDTIHSRTQPLLILHSHADRLFPVAMAHTLHAAAQAEGGPPAMLITPQLHPHNAIYQLVPQDYWLPVVQFIREHSISRTEAHHPG